MHDVDGAAGQPSDQDGAVDRLFFRPVRTGRREIGRLGAALGDRLVLEVAEHVAVLAVQLAEAAELRELFHRLGDELVGHHPVATLLVGHEELDRRDAHAERFGDALEDVRLVVEDEVEAEVQDGQRLSLLTEPRGRLGQGLARLVGDERQERRQSRARRGERRRTPVVVFRADVQVAVDEPGQYELAGGVDHAVGFRQERIGTDRDDLVATDRHRRLDDIGAGDDATTPNDDVDAGRAHRCGSFSVTGLSISP